MEPGTPGRDLDDGVGQAGLLGGDAAGELHVLPDQDCGTPLSTDGEQIRKATLRPDPREEVLPVPGSSLCPRECRSFPPRVCLLGSLVSTGDKAAVTEAGDGSACRRSRGERD